MNSLRPWALFRPRAGATGGILIHRACVVAIAFLIAPYLCAAQTFIEIEPNQGKAQANPVMCLSPGSVITGVTTGATSDPGPTSEDVFLLKTCPSPPGIYRHELMLTTGGPVGHWATILGLPQSGQPSDTTAVQTTNPASTPPRFNRWFGFGRGEMLYYRVAGTAVTTEPYTAIYSVTQIQPPTVPGFITSGLVTITTINRTLLDTELFLYDSNFNLIRWNDDTTSSATSTQSRIDVSLPPGDYYVAVSIFNTAIAPANGALPPNPPDNDDRSTSGNRLDFPDSLVRTSFSAAFQDLDFTVVDAFGNHDLSANVASSYDIFWARFVVIPPSVGCCFGDGACGLLSEQNCVLSGGLSQGANSNCITPGCPAPEACCTTGLLCTFVAPQFCIGTPQGAGSSCFVGACGVLAACCLADGSCLTTDATACAILGGTPGPAGSTCSSTVCAPPDPCAGFLAGDADCTGAVNNFDIDFYVLGVLNPPPPDVSQAPAQYLAAGGTQECWNHRRCWGDVDSDGAFNNFDIDSFISCILTPPTPGRGCGETPTACCLPSGCVSVRPAGCAILGGISVVGFDCADISCN